MLLSVVVVLLRLPLSGRNMVSWLVEVSEVVHVTVVAMKLLKIVLVVEVAIKLLKIVLVVDVVGLCPVRWRLRNLCSSRVLRRC